jgi:hypothetical protein
MRFILVLLYSYACVLAPEKSERSLGLIQESIAQQTEVDKTSYSPWFGTPAIRLQNNLEQI